jgi:GAF domain-containing protein
MEKLITEAENLFSQEMDVIANMANLSALIFNSLNNLNWAGFYILKNRELILGPFQGKPACVRIKIGRGVCGSAAEKRETVLVPDVHKFPGHIACDAASQSEIVIPVIKNGVLFGVLDIDSPVKNRFLQNDKIMFEKLVEIFKQNTEDL